MEKKKQKFKQTEIGKIPEEWEEGELITYLDLLKDGTHNPPKRVSKGIKFIAGASDLTYKNINFSKCTFITKEEYNKIHKFYELKEGDILLTIVGTIGNVAIVKKENLPFSLQRSIAILRTKKELDNNYLFYFITSSIFRNQLFSKINPTAQPGIYLGELGKIRISFPKSPKEQLSIASILSSLDEKIELNNKMNKTLEVIGQAIFKKWFIDEKKENLEIRKFGDLIKRNKEQIQNKESWDNEYLIDLSNMPQFSMSIVNFDKGSKFSSNIFKLNEYDILFGSIRPYFGKYGFSPINGVITGTIFSFLPKDKDDYAFCLFNICRKEFVEYTVAQSKGTKMPIIGWSEFQNYTVKYNKVLSKKFNDLIFPLIKEIKLNINQNQTLSSIRDALLPKLMSGEIRVK